ncbi:MAG TPA: SUMF1/EgtB/PvdO family nonheme iron enzyme [Steroidobacteraceae bacterium]|nr:SUMF1/EgtB/PvdO family nonheme iron enzyme [Steroidobacteraceae bacterium]
MKIHRTTPPVSRFERWLLVMLAVAWMPMAAGAAGPDALVPYRNFPLWDAGHVPLSAGNGPLDAPFLTVFPPRAGKANGTAVVIAPGGGNIMLMYGGEGADVAEVYNDWGVTAFVLTYRLSPRYDQEARTQDAERAMRLVRAHAAEWHLDPARIGFIGFSAGGSLGRSLVAASDAGDANSSDAVERASSRPDYAALIYGAGRATPGESLKDYPPTFLLSAAGDQPPSLANAQLFTELTQAGAIAELHVYQRGRHGFGTGYGSPEFGGWMPQLEHFLRIGGFLPAPGTATGTGTARTSAATPGTPAASTAAVARPPINDGYGDFVYVPAGTFRMGDAAGDGLARERPVHVVDLDAFYIGKFEVTNRDWRRFRDDAGYDDPQYWPNGHVVPRDQVPYWTQPNNHGGGTPGSDDYPVIGVNWDAASAYCAWLSAKTGQRYRLPTEAEWEKAARGTDGRRYPWGANLDRSLANYVGAQAYDTVQPVGFFKGNASPYGAFDMAGNVLEWCADWYDRDYYAVSPRRNPPGPKSGAYRVVRGGSFFVEASDLRSAARSLAWPSFQGHRMIGFRPVREP